jgi:hypothetical protein
MGLLLAGVLLTMAGGVELAGSAASLGGGLTEAPTIPGAVRFGNRSLVRGLRYPDDHDATLKNPNAHATRVAVQLPLHAVQRALVQVDLFENGLEYVDVGSPLDHSLEHCSALCWNPLLVCGCWSM